MILENEYDFYFLRTKEPHGFYWSIIEGLKNHLFYSQFEEDLNSIIAIIGIGFFFH